MLRFVFQLLVLCSAIDSPPLLFTLAFSGISADEEWSLLLDKEVGLISDEVAILWVEPTLDQVPFLISIFLLIVLLWQLVCKGQTLMTAPQVLILLLLLLLE